MMVSATIDRRMIGTITGPPLTMKNHNPLEIGSGDIGRISIGVDGAGEEH
jgi:hypothetical protein